MKARLIELGTQHLSSIFTKKIEENHFTTPFHFHDLCELNHVVNSYGKRIVGDNISNFSVGDLVLMSSNLPHMWYNDPSILKDSDTKSAKAIVTYFPCNFLGHLTDDPLVISKARALLEKAQRGLRFVGETQQKVSVKLHSLITKEGLPKVIEFLEIMDILLDSPEFEPLATVGYSHTFNEKDALRMNKVYQYLMNNFTEPISLADISAVANMTSPAFCNFFRKRTQKSFTLFVNELRIGHACRLLQDPELSISDVCFKSGYQSFANFNKFFKEITHRTPSQYRKESGVALTDL